MDIKQNSPASSKNIFQKLALPKIKIGLQLWITLAFIAVSVPLLLLSNFGLTRIAENRLTQFTGERLRQTNAAASAQVQAWINMNVNVLQQMASFEQIGSMDPAQQKPLLEATRRGYPSMFLIHTLDLQGIDVARSDNTLPVLYADRIWFQQAALGLAISSQTVISKDTGKPSLAMAVPIRNKDLKIVGVLSVTSQLSTIASALKLDQSGEYLSDGTITYVVESVGNNNIVVAHPDPKIAAELTDYTRYAPVMALRGGKSGSLTFTDDQGVEWAAYASELSNGWGVITQQPLAKANASLRQFQLMAIAVPGLGVLLAIAIGAFISHRLSRPILELTGKAQAIAAGNLEQSVHIRRADEIGDLAIAFNTMAVQLRGMLENERSQREYLQNTVSDYLAFLNNVGRGNLSVRLPAQSSGHGDQDPMLNLGRALNDMTTAQQRIITEIRDTAAALSAASAEILAASVQQATGASEQSAAIAQTSVTVDEVKAIAEQASLRAAEVTSESQRTVQVAQQGRRAVGDTIESMSQIKGRVNAIAENTLALSEQMQQISEIVSTVSQIAAQSNMLALNASVEAARAGEHGKGFAVVAAEVRALAEQSREAAQQIKSILADIQKATNATVMATEEGAKGVDRGISLTAEAQSAIENLSEVIHTAAQTAQQLAAGGQQQVTGVNQVAIAMQNIQQATVQNQASARQTERAAQDLNDLSGKLSGIVSQYTLE